MVADLTASTAMAAGMAYVLLVLMTDPPVKDGTRRPAPAAAALPLAAGLVLAALAVLLGASRASAHVHVDGRTRRGAATACSPSACPPSRTPPRRPSVTVTLPRTPRSRPPACEPVPGWTAAVTTARLATPIRTDDGEVSDYVARITWTANDPAAAIAPGEYQEFAVSVGPLPDVAELGLPDEADLRATADGGLERVASERPRSRSIPRRRSR